MCALSMLKTFTSELCCAFILKVWCHGLQFETTEPGKNGTRGLLRKKIIFMSPPDD